MDQAQIELIIGAVNASRPAIEQAKGDLASLYASVESYNRAAETAQDRFTSALRRTAAQLQELKGDAMGALKIQFPGVDDSELNKLRTLREEIGRIKQEAKDAEPAISGMMAAMAAQQVGGMLSAAGQRMESGIADLVKRGADLQTKELDVRGNTMMSDADARLMADTIRDRASKSPVDPGQMAEGFKRVANLGFEGADAVKIFDAALQAATATGAKMDSTANALAQTLKSMNIPAGEAGKVMNELHIAAAMGNEDLQQFAEYSNKAHSVAQAYGVSLADVDAALSTLTRHGYDAAQSQTGVVGMMVRIAAPAEKVKKELGEIDQLVGTNLTGDFTKAGLQAKGLHGILEDIVAAAGKLHMDPGVLAQQLIPAMRGGLQAQALVNPDVMPEYQGQIGTLSKALSGENNPLGKGEEERLKSLNAQLAILQNNLTLLGDDLMKTFGPSLEHVIKFLDKLLEDFRGLPEPVKESVATFAAVTTGITLLGGAALTTLGTIGMLMNGLKGLAGIPILGKLLGGGKGAAVSTEVAAAEFELPAVATAAAGGGGLLARLLAGGKGLLGELAGVFKPTGGSILDHFAGGGSHAQVHAAIQAAQSAGNPAQHAAMSAEAQHAINDAMGGEDLLKQSREAATAEKDAAKAAKQQAKDEAEELAAKHARFEAKAEQIRTLVASLPEQQQAAAQAQQMIPLLRQEQAEIGARLKQTQPESKEYWQLVREAWATEAQIGALNRSAIKEREKLIAEAQKAAEEQAKAEQKAVEEAAKAAKEAERAAKEAQRATSELHHAQFDATESMLRAVIGALPETQRAAAEVAGMIPILKARQGQIAADAAQLVPGTKEYWQKASEFYRVQEQVQQLNERGIKDESSQARQLADARLSLAQAQLGNMVGLTDQQRKEAMAPLLLEKLRELSRPVQGESELDRLQRLTGAEGVKGNLMDAFGVREHQARLLGGGSISMVDRRKLLMLDQEMRVAQASGEGDTIGGRSAGGDSGGHSDPGFSGMPRVVGKMVGGRMVRPVNNTQIVLNLPEGMNAQQITQAVQEQIERAVNGAVAGSSD